MFNIIIVGAGGFGREVYNWAMNSFPHEQYRIKGFLSNNSKDLDRFGMKVDILGDENTYEIEATDRFLFAIGNIDAKKRIVENMKVKGAQFLSLIHPTAIVSNTAKIGEGVIICPFVTVSDHVVIGDFVMMNFYSSCGHDANIGKYCIFSPYATVNGFSILEDEVFLGTHSTITAYRRICYRAKISANSLALWDVPQRSFLYGVPGKSKTIFLD